MFNLQLKDGRRYERVLVTWVGTREQLFKFLMEAAMELPKTTDEPLMFEVWRKVSGANREDAPTQREEQEALVEV